MQEAHPSHAIIIRDVRDVRDVGSGLNFKRVGLLNLLGQVHAGTVAAIVARHRDRLCRFGIELLEWLFAKSDTKLVVHGEFEENGAADAAGTSSDTRICGERSDRGELSDDILAIIGLLYCTQ